MIQLAAVLAVTLGSAARAQTVVSMDGPAMTQLQTASQGSGPAVFDGSVKRHEGPLDVLSEQEVLLKREPHRVCETEVDLGDGPPGHAGMIKHCSNVPGESENTYGTRQTVRIADRAGYEREAEAKGNLIGAGIGAGIGALGFLALLAGPLGWAIGFTSLVVGAIVGSIVGAGVAESKASRDPDVFERTVNEHTVVTRP
jgi:hypothetical protein